MYYVSNTFSVNRGKTPKDAVKYIEIRDTESDYVEAFTYEDIMILLLSDIQIKGAGIYYSFSDYTLKVPSSVTDRMMIPIRGTIKHFLLIDCFGDYKKTISYTLRYGIKIVVSANNALLYIDMDKFNGKYFDFSDIDTIDLSVVDIDIPYNTQVTPVIVKLGKTTKVLYSSEVAYQSSIKSFMQNTVFDLTECDDTTLRYNIIGIILNGGAKVEYKGDLDKFADLYFDYVVEKLNKGIEDDLYSMNSASYICRHFNSELYEVVKVRIEKYITDNSYYIDEVLSKSGSNAVHSALSTVLSNKRDLKWLNLKGEFSSEKYSRDKFEFIFYTIALLNIMKSFKNISGYLNLCLCLEEYDTVISSVRKYCDSKLPEWVYADGKNKRVKGGIKDIIGTIYCSSRHYRG